MFGLGNDNAADGRAASRRSRILLRWLVPLWLVLGLTVSLYFEVQMTAHFHPHTGMAFSGLDELGQGELWQAWRSRVLSINPARWVVDLSTHLPALPNKLDHPLGSLARGVGLWVALWFAATNICFVATFGRRSLLFLFGTFAAVAFGYMPGIGIRVYPWDMPALFFFSAWICLYHRRQLGWAVVLIPIAVAFKESAGVLCLAPLIIDGDIRARLRLVAAGAAGAMVAKVGTDLVSANSAVGATMMYSWDLFSNNLGSLFEPLSCFINAGTFVALFLLPANHRAVNHMRAMAGMVFAGNMVFGSITEYRIWFEAIPLALYGLDAAYRSGSEPGAVLGQERPRVSLPDTD
ncbi:MAG: hypothetical protein O2782_11765 [bacterium]|nr:hypothetical protein [bacterium]